MKGRTRVVAVLCLVIAGAWFFWNRQRSEGPRIAAPQANADAAASPSAKADSAAVATRQANVAAHEGSLDERPLAEVRAELERRAQAGDARAASRLGQAFLYCNNLPAATDAQIDNAVVEIGAHGGRILGELASSLTPDDEASLLKATMKYTHARCANAQGLDEKDATAQAFRWIERAAALGDADAQALYGEAMLKTYDMRRAIADPETLRDRLTQARTYVERSLSQGNALALLQTQAYYADGVYPANPESAYANLYAYTLTPRSADMPPQVLALMLSEASKVLDAAAIDRAREEGRRLAACCGVSEGDGR